MMSDIDYNLLILKPLHQYLHENDILLLLKVEQWSDGFPHQTLACLSHVGLQAHLHTLNKIR